MAKPLSQSYKMPLLKPLTSLACKLPCDLCRLERAGKASTGTSRAEVMESMYGRFKPTPKGNAHKH